MHVTDALIENLAHLARLEFTAAEKTAIKQDLQRMITFVEKLNELNTEEVAPLIHITEDYNIFRTDEVIPSISKEEGLKNAPSHNNDFFKVPKVIKK